MWHKLCSIASICCVFVVQLDLQQVVRRILNKSKANSKSTTSPQHVVEQTASLTTSHATCCTTNPQVIEVMESDTNDNHQWLKYGGTRGNAPFPHLHFLVQSVPPPQISKRCKGTLRGTLGYADTCCISAYCVVNCLLPLSPCPSTRRGPRPPTGGPKLPTGGPSQNYSSPTSKFIL